MIHIHEVQKLTGVTVRTLRHYDSIDLLKPASRTEGGHRLYTNEEIKNLQQIQFLQSIGFSLQDIKSMLASDEWNFTDSLKKQIAFVQKEQTHLQEKEQLLRELIHGIGMEGKDHWGAIQKIMHMSRQDQAMKKKYRDSMFNKRELTLWEDVPNISVDDPDALEWIALIGQIKKHMHQGPRAKKVQDVIKRMDDKREETFAGEEEFIDKLWDMRMSLEESENLGLYPIDQDVLDFMNEAYIVYAAKKEDENDGASS